MKKKTLFAALLAVTISQAGFAQDSTANRPQQSSDGGIFGKILKAVSSASAGTSGSLTNSDIATGLREALSIGVSNGSAQASQLDGYFKNPLLKLAFPPEAQKVASTLRQLGLNKQVDQFELSLNRAAEDAAKKAKPVFIKAITSMSIQDAVGILRGQTDAATQYLRRTSGQQLITEKKLTLGIAESCTGGYVSAQITKVPGSSAYFWGSIVSYNNAVKIAQLNVQPETLDQFGAVSEQTIRQMAEGIRNALGTSVGIATSGIAGPDGGTPDKPVGTIWIACATNHRTVTRLLKLGQYRDQNIQLTTTYLLNMLREELLN